jgi:multiple sugar transport system permease protein
MAELKVYKSTAFTYAGLLIASSVFFAPLVFVVSIALSSDQTVSTGSFSLIPTEYRWDNFVRIFQTQQPV